MSTQDKFAGLEWDGKRWIDPANGQAMYLTPWQRTGWAGKTVVWATAIAIAIPLLVLMWESR